MDEPVRRGAAYDERFDRLAASGLNVHGEADLVSVLLEGGPAQVLDAGCGTGRVAIELSRRGFEVVGVDLDPHMLAAARAKAPELRWVEADLAAPGFDLGRRFDLVVAAGNVMIFLAPGTEAVAVANLARHLVPGGLLVAGFQLGEKGQKGQKGRLALAGADGYDAMCADAGLSLAHRWATWERGPWGDGGDYAVSAHRAGA